MHGNVGTLAWTLCYIVVLLGLSFFGLHRYFIIYLYFRHRRQNLKPQSRFADLPVVTVQLPIYNERYVLERLLRAVSLIDYPKEKLEIQVLDDSTDETSGIAMREFTKAFRTLAGDQRQALLLTALEGQSHETIAGACSVAIGTVKSRVSRARARLREMLDLEIGDFSLAASPGPVGHAAAVA